MKKETKRQLSVLVACEESQAVCKAFRELGHNAYSCDLLPCSGGHPEWHFNCDCFEIIGNKGGVLQNGETVYVEKWDLIIYHPPCTYLASSGSQWLSHPDDKHLPLEERRPHPLYPNRRKDMDDSIKFVKALSDININYIAIENPVGLLSSRWRKPDQIIQPWMFGDEATKTTCLWLKNLPQLIPTNIVGKGEREMFTSGKSHPKWYADALRNAKTPEERRTLRSKTFPGIAQVMATQWSQYLIEQI